VLSSKAPHSASLSVSLLLPLASLTLVTTARDSTGQTLSYTPHGFPTATGASRKKEHDHWGDSEGHMPCE